MSKTSTTLLALPSLDAFDLKPRTEGERFLAPLSRFEEDPNNPRTEHDAPDDPNWLAFVDDIRAHGILQPIVVRVLGFKLRICFGARRFRAATLIGLPTIPYVLLGSDELDEYAQVSENEQRKNLKPHELAAFIVKRIALGDKRSAIAQKLGISESQMVFVLSLHEAPAPLLALYEANKVRSPQVFHSLRTAYTQRDSAGQAELLAACNAAPSLSRSVVDALTKSDVSTPPRARETSATSRKTTQAATLTGRAHVPINNHHATARCYPVALAGQQYIINVNDAGAWITSPSNQRTKLVQDTLTPLAP